jgi:hypothetical protein
MARPVLAPDGRDPKTRRQAVQEALRGHTLGKIRPALPDIRPVTKQETSLLKSRRPGPLVNTETNEPTRFQGLDIQGAIRRKLPTLRKKPAATGASAPAATDASAHTKQAAPTAGKKRLFDPQRPPEVSLRKALDPDQQQGKEPFQPAKIAAVAPPLVSGASEIPPTQASLPQEGDDDGAQVTWF